MQFLDKLLAVSQGGVEGERSNEVSVLTDDTAPAPPTGLTASSGTAQVTLRWNANAELDAAGYTVYRAVSSSGPYSRLTQTPVTGRTFVDAGLVNGTTYYYVVTASDTRAAESAASFHRSDAVVLPVRQVDGAIACDHQPAPSLKSRLHGRAVRISRFTGAG